jgi:hypothetical protein
MGWLPASRAILRDSLRQSRRQAIVDPVIELKDLIVSDECHKVPHAVEDSLAIPAVPEVILEPRLRVAVEIVIDIVGDIPPHFHATDLDNELFVLHSPGSPLSNACY